MTRKGYWGEFAKYTSLNVLGMIGLSFYILADTYFVSKGLGANGLTALNLAIPVYSFIHGSGLMIGMGGGTKYAICKSRGEDREADRIFTHAVGLAALFAVFFVLLGLFLSGPITALLGADASVYQMTKTYLQVILLFAPAFLLNNVLLCFVRNDGAPQLSMAAMIGGSLSNVVLDWVFIFPCGMGIFGAVFATGLAPIISILLLSPHFIRRKNRFHPVKCRPEGKRAAGILSSGVPSLITEVSSGVVIIVFNAIILQLSGNIGVAAYGVIANLSLVVIAIYNGIAQGIQPLVSRSCGMGDAAGVRAFLRYAMTVMLLLSGLIYLTVFFGAPPLPPFSTASRTPCCSPSPKRACGSTSSAAPLRDAASCSPSTLPPPNGPGRPRSFPCSGGSSSSSPWPSCWPLSGGYGGSGWPSPPPNCWWRPWGWPSSFPAGGKGRILPPDLLSTAGFPALQRGKAGPFPEDFRKVTLILKAAGNADVQNRPVGFQQQLFCLLHPQADDILDGGKADDIPKYPHAFPAADKGAVRNLLHPNGLGIVHFYEGEHLPDAVGFGLAFGRPADGLPLLLQQQQKDGRKGRPGMDFIPEGLVCQRAKGLLRLFQGGLLPGGPAAGRPYG